jgi:large subunit ribosomal protein L19
MPTKTEQFYKSQLKTLPNIGPGDTVRVHQKVKESSAKANDKKNKEKMQIFEGVIIAKKHGKGISATITVRKVVEGVGVERIFPIHSPSIGKIEVVGSGKVRRSKLYYLRTAKRKKSKLKNKEFISVIAEESTLEPVTAPEENQPESTPENTETK